MNFRTFLASYRVNFAKHLLRSKGARSLRISDIALQSGFSSINSFNRAFREITGVTPSEYRRLKYR
jgi:AraC-like DNA-binding protein